MLSRYAAAASSGIKQPNASPDDDELCDDVSKLGESFISFLEARSAALQTFERQFFRSLVSNLRKAESFFFDHVAALRQAIHAAVTSRDAAAARALKVGLWCDGAMKQSAWSRDSVAARPS